jgi:hypothetical protein
LAVVGAAVTGDDVDTGLAVEGIKVPGVEIGEPVDGPEVICEPVMDEAA